MGAPQLLIYEAARWTGVGMDESPLDLILKCSAASDAIFEHFLLGLQAFSELLNWSRLNKFQARSHYAEAIKGSLGRRETQEEPGMLSIQNKFQSRTLRLIMGIKYFLKPGVQW